MIKSDLLSALSHIPDDADIVIVVINPTDDEVEDGSVLRISDVGYQAGLHVIRAELP